MHQLSGYYWDFKLVYRTNGGDNCNMKKANEIFSKDDRNWKMVVFRKKGSTEVLGFITLYNLQFINRGIYKDYEA